MQQSTHLNSDDLASFKTYFCSTAYVWSDNLSDLPATNNRLRWIITPGPDLYLVYNQNWLDDEQFDSFQTLQRNGAIKISNTHRFESKAIFAKGRAISA